MSKAEFLAGASPVNIVYRADGNITRMLTSAELASIKITTNTAYNTIPKASVRGKDPEITEDNTKIPRGISLGGTDFELGQ